MEIYFTEWKFMLIEEKYILILYKNYFDNQFLGCDYKLSQSIERL